MKKLLGSVAALALFCQPAQANFTFPNASSVSVTAFAFDGSTTPPGTSNCASTTECGASVPITIAGLPLFTATNPGFSSLNATPTLANGNGVVQTQGGAVLSVTNGEYANLLQGNAVISATNGLYSNLLQGNAVIASGNPLFAQLTAGAANIGAITNSTFAATQATAGNLNATVVGTGTFATQLTGATNNINNISGTISLPTGAASALADNAAWAVGTTPATPEGCEYTSGGATALTTGHVGTPGCTSARAQFFDLESVVGTALGAPSNYGTSPGAVEVLGVNAFITNTPAITGTVTANAGTNLNTSLLALETGGNLATTATNTGTIAGAVTSSVMQNNLKQVNGTTVLVNTGATGAGSPRMTVAVDTATIAGSVPGTAGTASANVVTVQGVASMTALLANPGTVATWGLAPVAAGTAPTNMQVGGLVYNSTPLTPTTGQSLALQGDANGYLEVNVKAGAAGGTSSSINATYPTTGTAAGAEYLSSAPTLTSGQMVALQTTVAGSLHTTVDNSNANGSAGSASSSPVVIASDQAAVATKAASAAFVAGSIADLAHGQGIMSGSVPVVIASDQSAVAVKAASAAFASGSIASGALAAGSISSGAAVSGAFAAGAIADLAHGQGTMATSVPVTVASNQSALPVNQTQINGATLSVTNPGFTEITDGTHAAAATKAASTAAVATDPSLVMQLNPSSPGIIALGQTTMSASVPVTMASNQSVIPVSPTTYPATAVPLTATATGTTAATTATLTNVSGHTTYICGFAIRANATAAATGNATVTGTISGTMNFSQWTAPLASGIGTVEERFVPCVPASAVSTSIAVVSAAPGTAGVVSVSAWGYSI